MSSQRSSFLKTLTPVSLDDISSLTCECFVWSASASLVGGLISFHGTYRPGSAGTEDALFIKWRTGQFCDLPEPGPIQALVVDFRDMDYRWGDDLDVPAPRLRRAERPIRVVVNAEQLDKYESILGVDETRTDLDAAVMEVNEILRDMRL